MQRQRWRVDTVPWWVFPMYFAFSLLMALLWYCVNALLHTTCRVSEQEEAPLPAGASIYCCWHRSIEPLMTAYLRFPDHYWINHPAWYMKPVHLLAGFYGVTMVLGSTGHEGKKAADELEVRLLKGHSTWMFPDGPNGPPEVLKRGVLHIAMHTGVPIVPVRIEARYALVMGWTWDKKRFPLPFSRISVRYGKPIVVTLENIVASEREISAAL